MLLLLVVVLFFFSYAFILQMLLIFSLIVSTPFSSFLRSLLALSVLMLWCWWRRLFRWVFIAVRCRCVAAIAVVWMLSPLLTFRCCSGIAVAVVWMWLCCCHMLWFRRCCDIAIAGTAIQCSRPKGLAKRQELTWYPDTPVFSTERSRVTRPSSGLTKK